MRFTSKILPSRKSNLGIIELNNAPALHALTLDMIHCMNDVWEEWTTIHPEEQGLSSILVKSSSDCKRPSFCAGGDVKAVWKDGIKNKSRAAAGGGIPGVLTSDFFREEYTLNYKMATSTIPQISLWDGIVMGGGTGISMHGRYRVATEHTIFAMPETAIGFFCDVGSLWWMPRLLSGGMAPYLTLTGARLKAADLLYTGIATHYVPSDQLPDLETALAEATTNNDVVSPYNDVVAPVLEKFHVVPENGDKIGFLQQHQTIIDETFGSDEGIKSVEDIISKLQSINTDFCQTTLQTLSRQSPTSLKVTFEGLQQSKHHMTSIGEELQMEYRLSQAFLMRPDSDFYRGIRSVLVERSKEPVQWSPSKLEDVTDDMVQSYFTTSLGEYEWNIPDTTTTNSSKL